MSRLTDIGDAVEQLRSLLGTTTAITTTATKMPAKPRPGSCEKPQTTNNLLIFVMPEPAI